MKKLFFCLNLRYRINFISGFESELTSAKYSKNCHSKSLTECDMNVIFTILRKPHRNLKNASNLGIFRKQ